MFRTQFKGYQYAGAAGLNSAAVEMLSIVSTSYYSSMEHTFREVASQPVKISGHPAWEITFLVTYSHVDGPPSWSEERGAVVFADRGTGQEPAVLFVSIPSNLGESKAASLVSSLQLTTLPSSP